MCEIVKRGVFSWLERFAEEAIPTKIAKMINAGFIEHPSAFVNALRCCFVFTFFLCWLCNRFYSFLHDVVCKAD